MNVLKHGVIASKPRMNKDTLIWGNKARSMQYNTER